MKEWIECTLEEATAVEINGKVWELSNNGKVVKTYCLNTDTLEGVNVMVGFNDWEPIHQDLFRFLNIKCLKEKKRVPIEFEATFAKYDGKWHPLYSLDDGLSYQNCKKAKFRCVQIMEDEE